MNDVDLESRLRSVLSADGAALPPSPWTSQEVLAESHRDAVRGLGVVSRRSRRWQAGLAMGAAAAAVVAVIGVGVAVRSGRGDHAAMNAASPSAVADAAWPTPCPQQLPDTADPAENFGSFVGLVAGNSGGLEYRMSYRAGTHTVLLGVCVWDRTNPAGTVYADQVGNWMGHEVSLGTGWNPAVYQLVHESVYGFVGFVPETASTASMTYSDGSPATPLSLTEQTFNGYRIAYGRLPVPEGKPRLDSRDADGRPLTQRNMYVPFHDLVGPNR